MGKEKICTMKKNYKRIIILALLTLNILEYHRYSLICSIDSNTKNNISSQTIISTFGDDDETPAFKR